MEQCVGCCAHGIERQLAACPALSPPSTAHPPTNTVQVERIPEPVLAGITARILPALAYMHAHRMVHRDIKPANILMSTDGHPKVPAHAANCLLGCKLRRSARLLGFGLWCAIGCSNACVAGRRLGQQWRRQQRVGGRLGAGRSIV